jgi:hypothetical protein
MGRGDTTHRGRLATRLAHVALTISCTLALSSCNNFEVLSLDEIGPDGFGLSEDQPPDDPGDQGQTDSDSDADTDTDSDCDVDTDAPWDTGPDWDTAVDGFGEVARACAVSTFGGDGARIWITGAAPFPDGSIAVAGGFRGSALFGRGEDAETELEPTFADDLVNGFLARFEPDGRLCWAASVGTALHADPPISAIAVFPDGGIAITGGFTGTALFGVGDAAQPPLEASAATDMYVARYSGSGKLGWVVVAGGSSGSRGQGIAALDDGSIAVTGHYSGTIVLGENEPGQTALPAHSGLQLLVARYSPNGQLIWATTADGALSAAAIPSTEDGRILVSAWSADAIHLSAFDGDGELDWQVVGSGGSPRASAAALADGSFALAGGFVGWLELPGQDGPIELTSPCPLDEDEPCRPGLLLAAIDAQGDVSWAATSTSGPEDGAVGAGAIGLDDGSLLAAGTFCGAVGFGEGELEDTWLVSTGSSEPFAAIYGAEAELQGVERLGAAWEDADAIGTVAREDGGLAVVGTFAGAAELVGADDEAFDIEAMGERDGYLLHVCP